MATSPFNWDKCMQHVAMTDVGMRRANNQDACVEILLDDVQSWFERGHLFIVADGMGAHAAGELASKLAVDNISHLYYKHRELSPPEAVMLAVQETNTEIHRRGQANPDFHNMGTTSSALVVLPQGALVAHVGDSRVYRLRGNQFEQLTFDHSLVWEMRAAGQLSGDAEVASAIPKNVITRSLGPRPVVQVDLEGPYPLEVGDVFLLCSDGLTGQVADDEIAAMLAAMPPKEAARSLIDLANLRGGPDNITVIIVKISGREIVDASAQAEPLTVGAEAERERDVHPALWIVMGVCLLAGVGMAVMGHITPAVVAWIGGIIAATAAILQKFGGLGGKAGVALASGKRLGKGPHVKVDVAENGEVIGRLLGVLRELREAVLAENLAVDIPAFDKLAQQAETHAEQKQYAPAVREACKAMSTLMKELRNQRKKKLSDSNIEY